MQNKLAATFGMPRHLSPTHFHHFSCFSAALLLHIWMPQGMENKKKKKSKRKRKICDNFVSLSLVSGRATKILGNIFSPISIFVATHFFFSFYCKQQIPVNCRRAINQRGVIKGKNLSGKAIKKKKQAACLTVFKLGGKRFWIIMTIWKVFDFCWLSGE